MNVRSSKSVLSVSCYRVLLIFGFGFGFGDEIRFFFFYINKLSLVLYYFLKTIENIIYIITNNK